MRPPAPVTSRVLLAVAGALVAGMLAGLLVFYPHSKTGNSKTGVNSLTPHDMVIPPAAVPSKLEEAAQTKPVVSPIVPPEIPADVPQPAKRNIELTTHPEKFSRSVDKHVDRDAKRKKAEVPSSHVGSNGHSPQVAARSQRNETKADMQATPTAPPIEDFGMNLQRPTTRRPTQKIDETDPYTP